ncbi:MAG: protein kinase [Polyangiaceae bacterium]
MRLHSEYTARTLDAGRLPSGAPYVVSEASQGADLREVVRMRGLLTLTEAVDFVLQAAESVAEAHSMRLIHRGLNLSTLFVTRRPDGFAQVKVQDYGVADALRPDPMRIGGFGEAFTMFENPAVETLACLSPEQVRASGEIDERSDIWALGAILHHMLSGSPVYAAPTLMGLLASIVADTAAPITSLRSDVPAGLESLILRCLAKDREARFASVADFASALRRFASPEAQVAADRIARTLGRAGRTLPVGVNPSALVHIGPAPAPPRAEPAVAKPSGPLNHPMVASSFLIALGLVAGSIVGALVATGSLGGTAKPSSDVREQALAQRISAQQPEPEPSEATPAPQPSVAPPAKPVSAPPPARPSRATVAAPHEGDKPAPPLLAPPVRAEKPDKPAKAVAAAPSARSEKGAAEPRATATLANDLFDSVR